MWKFVSHILNSFSSNKGVDVCCCFVFLDKLSSSVFVNLESHHHLSSVSIIGRDGCCPT